MSVIPILRKSFFAAFTLSLTWLLAGCVTFTADLVVDDNDRVSGSIVVAYPVQFVDLVNEDPQLSGWQKRYESLDGVSIRGVDRDGQVGNEVVLTAVPIDEFSVAGTGQPPLRIVRLDDELSISGELDFSGYSEEPAGDAGVVQASYAFFAPADLRVSITVPGEILSTNGTVDDDTNTITWKLRLGQENRMEARVLSPLPHPLSGGIAWGVFGAIVLGLIAATAIVMSGRRRRTITPRSTTQPAAEDSASAS